MSAITSMHLLVGNGLCLRIGAQGVYHMPAGRMFRDSLLPRIARRPKSSHQRKKPRKSTLQPQASSSQTRQGPRGEASNVTRSEVAPVKYAAPSSPSDLQKPSALHAPTHIYELLTARGLTWTTWISTVFFSGTAVLTVQNYTAVAATQPFIYYLGMGLSALWVSVAGYCFYAPLKLVRSVRLLPRTSWDPSHPDEKLEITFQQVLPLIKYKPITIDVDEVGTNYALAAFRGKLQYDNETTEMTAGPLKAYYRHFIKMFSRHSMAYVKIGDKGIWKMDLDPKTSSLPSGAKVLDRVIRPQHFQPWWSLRA